MKYWIIGFLIIIIGVFIISYWKIILAVLGTGLLMWLMAINIGKDKKTKKINYDKINENSDIIAISGKNFFETFENNF
ncbi:hypothetical protein [Caminibacter sp.]